MRQLLNHSDGVLLQRFCRILYANGIESEVEQGPTGEFLFWVVSDDHLPVAQQLWSEFVNAPDSPQMRQWEAEGEKRFLQQKKEEQKSRFKVIPGRSTFNRSSPDEMQFFTTGLLILCIGLFSCTLTIPEFRSIELKLYISEYISPRTLPEVQQGQLWRLFTPVLLHANFIHLLFNLMLLYPLGNAIESRIGGKLFLPLILFLAIVSNLTQYIPFGPNFVGASGVVFGLIGFAAYVQRRSPWEYLGLNSGVFTMAILWLALGIVLAGMPSMLGRMANGAHVGGLMAGLLMGWFYHQILKVFIRRDE
ncbi:MAG: rhomboid family intramembrane serine protease [Candidatus Sumerlaeia bacterium]|nr:rhomboid family intramembrane serine protease [Candidatus Sumerlaeia bacterium]